MASSDVNRLIDMLYERIEEAKAPALKPGMSIVDRDEMLDLLDELRAQLPVEVKRPGTAVGPGEVCGGGQTGRGPHDAAGGAGGPYEGIR